MIAEDLLLYANAHGVDLMRAAKNMTSDDPEIMRAARDVVRKRFDSGRTAIVLIEPPQSMARGRETRSVRRPEWSAAELAQAAGGVPDLYFRTAIFAYAGERKWFKWLGGELAAEMLRIRDEAAWPPVVEDLHGHEVIYHKHLASLVLDEDNYPNFFKIDPALYPVYMNLTPRIWYRDMEGRFKVLKNVWTSWAHEALRIMQPKLRQHEETV